MITSNLRTKLTLGFLAVALLVSANSLFITFNDHRIQEEIDEFIHINIEEIALSLETAFLIQRIESNLRELMLATMLGVFFAHRVSDPIIRIKNAADHIGHGSFDHSSIPNTQDEIGELAGAFSSMTARLQRPLPIPRRPCCQKPGDAYPFYSLECTCGITTTSRRE